MTTALLTPGWTADAAPVTILPPTLVPEPVTPLPPAVISKPPAEDAKTSEADIPLSSLPTGYGGMAENTPNLLVDTAYTIKVPTGNIRVDASSGVIRLFLPSLYTTTDKIPLIITRVKGDHNILLVPTDGVKINKTQDLLCMAKDRRSLVLRFHGDDWEVV